MRAGVKQHLCFQPADTFVLDMFIIKVISADFHHLTYQSCLSFSCLHTNELVQESREPRRTARDRQAPSEASSCVQAHIGAHLESACIWVTFLCWGAVPGRAQHPAPGWRSCQHRAAAVGSSTSTCPVLLPQHSPWGTCPCRPVGAPVPYQGTICFIHILQRT